MEEQALMMLYAELLRNRLSLGSAFSAELCRAAWSDAMCAMDVAHEMADKPRDSLGRFAPVDE